MWITFVLACRAPPDPSSRQITSLSSTARFVSCYDHSTSALRFSQLLKSTMLLPDGPRLWLPGIASPPVFKLQ